MTPQTPVQQARAKVVPPYWVTFDEMTWPAVGLADLEWRMRYTDTTKQDRLVAAGVIDAYIALLNKPVRQRNAIISKIRAARAIRAEARKKLR